MTTTPHGADRWPLTSVSKPNQGDGEGPCTDCMATLPAAQMAIPLAYLCHQVPPLSTNTSQRRSDKVPVSGHRRVQGDGQQTVRGGE